MNPTFSQAHLVPIMPSSHQDPLLHRIAHRIRRSLELQEILDTTVTEVQQFLKVDRVKIYKFHPDHSGEVIAEALAPDQPLPSLYGLNFPADDIPPHARQLFIEARVRTVTNVKSGLIGQSRLRDPETGELVSEELAFRPLDPCHQEYLTTMGVQSSLGAPIFHEDQLWGLLVAHHREPQDMTIDQLEVIQFVLDKVSIAIAQSTLLQQARDQAQQKSSLHHISTLLHSLPTLEIEGALEATVDALQGSGGRLWIAPNFFPMGNANSLEIPGVYTHGTQPILHEHSPFPMMEQYHGIQSHFHLEDPQPWVIDDVYQVGELRTLQSAFRSTAIRSLLILPLTTRTQIMGYLTIFRDEFETEKLWAGQCDLDQRQEFPRQSFDLWRQSKTGQIRPWLDRDLELSQQIARQFTSEIEQYALYQQVQALNTNLEAQVQARTIELEQKNQYQETLFKVVSKVRESLDLNTIFKTTTLEVRQVLQADRVGLFRFYEESGWHDGEFVWEDVNPEFPAAIAQKIHDHCFGDQFAVHYQQGRVQNVADIYNAGMSDCHIQVLARFQVRANLVVPLLQGPKLWGLLCIHQCSQPRHWNAIEIQFVQQIAAQLSIALEQSELLEMTTQQAEKLTEMLSELKRTQSQLIQTEKMSSLGQLVAGIAHEINNPVTFIHGNISHVSTYMQALLSLVDRYQACYGIENLEIKKLLEDIDLEFLTRDLYKVLSSMHVGTQRIREIVLSLRNFARLDEAEKKPIDIHEGIESTLLILQHRLTSNDDQRKIEVIKHYGDLPKVECYASQINQVLINILSNAIDTLEERQKHDSGLDIEHHSSVITIVTEKVGDNHIRIAIGDNGFGIPENSIPKLFDPFYTTKPVGQGTGLGLAISYKIITEKHQGKLQCFSTIGVGSQFVIEIPIQ
jgi:GAF domain-containing protein